MSDKKLVAFFDNVGRTIFGEQVDESDTNLKVKNPVVLHVQQAEGGRMALQLFPCFFREFLIDPNEGVVVDYNKSNISICDKGMTFNVQLSVQYENMFKAIEEAPVITPTTPVAGPDAVASPPAEQNDVIQLFDE
jgi:hypothetical protein